MSIMNIRLRQSVERYTIERYAQKDVFMDPKATLIELLEAVACGEPDDVRDIADNLAEWFARGGHGAGGARSPVTDAAEVALKAIRAAR